MNKSINYTSTQIMIDMTWHKVSVSCLIRVSIMIKWKKFMISPKNSTKFPKYSCNLICLLKVDFFIMWIIICQLITKLIAFDYDK